MAPDELIHVALFHVRLIHAFHLYLRLRCELPCSQETFNVWRYLTVERSQAQGAMVAVDVAMYAQIAGRGLKVLIHDGYFLCFSTHAPPAEVEAPIEWQQAHGYGDVAGKSIDLAAIGVTELTDRNTYFQASSNGHRSAFKKLALQLNGGKRDQQGEDRSHLEDIVTHLVKVYAGLWKATFGAVNSTSPVELDPSWANAGLWGLLLASFLAATVLPFSSELILAAMAAGPWSTASLLLVASAGNWAGGMTCYGLGRMGDLGRIMHWLRSDPQTIDRAMGWMKGYGSWAALLTWIPIIGDPIAIALGLGKAPLLPVSILMLLGKAARYAVILSILR